MAWALQLKIVLVVLLLCHRERQAWLFCNRWYFLKGSIVDVVLLIASDNVWKVGNAKLQIPRNNLYSFQMMWLGYVKVLTFILVPILFAYAVNFCWKLPFLFSFLLLFSKFNKPHFSSQSKMSQRTVNYTFIYFLSENVFLYWGWLFKIFNVKLANVHHITDVELAKPTLWLCDP